MAAGVTIQHIRDATQGEQHVVRCMPNLAAEHCLSPSVAVACPGLGMDQMRIAEQILTAIGSIHWIDDEDTMHAVTAISGSGPAYLFVFAEALSEVATALGISRDLALDLSIDTIAGAAALLQKHKNPSALCNQVASPGGTTQAALDVLKETGGLQALITRAASAAATRSRTLSENG